MRKLTRWLALAGLVWAFPAGAAPAAEPPQNVILVGWDGVHRDHVQALLKAGKLPHLQQLIAEGTLVDIDVTSGATDTKAGWTQILTGYRPEVTGVYNNGRFQDVPAGYSVFERLKARLGADRFAAVAVIGKRAHCGEINPPEKRPYDPALTNAAVADQGQPAGRKAKAGGGKRAAARTGAAERVVEENGQKFLVSGGSPYYTMHKACDEWHFGLEQDAKVGDQALAMLGKYKDKPFFFFVHFAQVDHQGHKYGEPSPEYNDAIVSGDAQLGRLVAKLKDLKLYERTKIYVTADHGFDVGKKAHHYAPYVFLATNDKQVMRGGTRADIAPTILARFGCDLAQFTPPLDGESLLAPATKPVGKAPPRKSAAAGKRAGRKKPA